MKRDIGHCLRMKAQVAAAFLGLVGLPGSGAAALDSADRLVGLWGSEQVLDPRVRNKFRSELIPQYIIPAALQTGVRAGN